MTAHLFSSYLEVDQRAVGAEHSAPAAVLNADAEVGAGVRDAAAP